MTFTEYVDILQALHPEKRVHRFDFEGQSYWLKQPEQSQGSQRLLKPFSTQAFKQEIQRIKWLMLQKAPIPEVKIINNHCLVMEDAGRTVRSLLESDLSEHQKLRILDDCVKALIRLHEQNIVHGRPLLKDILWQNGKVSFIDFEVASHSPNKKWQKIRDSILFIYGVCCETSPKQIQHTIETFSRYADSHIWQGLLYLIKKYRFIYYFLLPFKPFARKDLIT